MTNLYDMLRDLQRQWNEEKDVELSEEQWELIEHLLAGPEHELHLRANPMEGTPELRIHGAVKGAPADVYGLLLEAMAMCPTLAQLVLAAAHRYATMVPICRFCSTRHHGHGPHDCPPLDGGGNPWEFKKRTR
jgi:hypothetical protein